MASTELPPRPERYVRSIRDAEVQLTDRLGVGEELQTTIFTIASPTRTQKRRYWTVFAGSILLILATDFLSIPAAVSILLDLLALGIIFWAFFTTWTNKAWLILTDTRMFLVPTTYGGRRPTQLALLELARGEVRIAWRSKRKLQIEGPGGRTLSLVWPDDVAYIRKWMMK
jgi:hypothetical protein